MPCRDNWGPPDPREEESKAVANHLLYVMEKLNLVVPKIVSSTAQRGNAKRLGELGEMLCEICTAMTEEEKDRIIYNGRIAAARALADWWDDHQARDRKRAAREAARAHRKSLVESGRAKLTNEEYIALKKSIINEEV